MIAKCLDWCYWICDLHVPPLTYLRNTFKKFCQCNVCLLMQLPFAVHQRRALAMELITKKLYKPSIPWCMCDHYYKLWVVQNIQGKNITNIWIACTRLLIAGSFQSSKGCSLFSLLVVQFWNKFLWTENCISFYLLKQGSWRWQLSFEHLK